MSIVDVSHLVTHLEDGDLKRDLITEGKELIAFLLDLTSNRPTAKTKGSISLVLTFEVEGSVATIRPLIKVKKPEKVRQKSDPYFVLKDGSLSTDHPKQTIMPGILRQIHSNE